MEGIGGPPLGPEEMLDAIYYAVCTLKRELVSHLSYAKIIWTADTGPYFPYENLTADGCVDLWIDMVRMSIHVFNYYHCYLSHVSHATCTEPIST